MFFIKPNKNGTRHIVPTGQKRIWGIFILPTYSPPRRTKKNEVLKFRPFKIDTHILDLCINEVISPKY